MSTYSASRRISGLSHPLDGRFGGYYRGSVPQVPWGTGYDPGYGLIPSSGTWLGNPTSHTRYGPTTH
jgi:hypothetical protein